MNTLQNTRMRNSTTYAQRLLKSLVIVLLFLGQSPNLYSQDFWNRPWADKKTEKRAKKETKRMLDSLKPILDLKSKDTRPRNFVLEICERELKDTTGYTATPAGDFPEVSGCPGIFIYSYVQKRKRGSYYYINFFYDNHGRIKDREIGYTYVIY